MRVTRDGASQDEIFDRHFAPDLRVASGRHFTPLKVVHRAAQWFNTLGVETVVDVGSGAGKFCVAAALATECAFTGLERRPRLVSAARRLASAFGVQDRVRFVSGVFGEAKVPEADCYYFYNPFGENIGDPADWIEPDIERGDWRFVHDVQTTRDFLANLPTGTLVLTYHGYGGRLPHGFETIRVDRTFSGDLRLWEFKKKR